MRTGLLTPVFLGQDLLFRHLPEGLEDEDRPRRRNRTRLPRP